jgi:hypothetical protein
VQFCKTESIEKSNFHLIDQIHDFPKSRPNQ